MASFLPKALRTCSTLALVAATLATAPAYAQTEEVITQEEFFLLSTVVLEARRRTEQLIDIPISATVLDREALEQQRISDNTDLSDRTPNFVLPTFGDNPRASQPIIRGIGALNSVLASDNSTVPTFVDGVPLPGFAASGSLFDIDQVDVLRGPQGTAFGRNATGGAVIVTTPTPDDVTERSIGFELGEDGYAKVTGIASGQIAENVFGRVALSFTTNGDYVINEQPGAENFGAYDLGNFRGTLLFTPTDRTEIKVTASYENDDRETGSVVQLRDANAFQTPPTFQREVAGLTVNVTHEFDRFIFSSVTGYHRYEADFTSDLSDGILNEALIGFPPFFFINDGEASINAEQEDQFYQEFRLNSLPEDRIGWAVGVSYSQNEFREQSIGTSVIFETANGNRDIEIDTRSFGIFGDATIPFGQFEVGIGARYTNETKDLRATYDRTTPDVFAFAQADSVDFELFSGRLSLGYKPTEDSLVYVSYNRGAKAGGFARSTNNAALGIAEVPYDETTIDAFEVGYKADFVDIGLSLAVSAFYNDIKDEALIAFVPPNAFTVENFDLETTGVEIEVSGNLGDYTNFYAGLGLIDGEITRVPAGSTTGAVAGNDIPLVADVSVNLGLDYRSDIGVLNWGLDEEIYGSINYSYLSARASEASNTVDLDEQHIVNLRAGVTNGQFDYYVFADNLLDENIEQSGNDFGGGVVSVLPTRGRVVGVGATFRF